jgi:hypothetical protein
MVLVTSLVYIIDNVNPLLREALILSKSYQNLDSQGTYSWFTFVKNITWTKTFSIKLLTVI